jgi:hypothetical protein
MSGFILNRDGSFKEFVPFVPRRERSLRGWCQAFVLHLWQVMP